MRIDQTVLGLSFIALCYLFMAGVTFQIVDSMPNQCAYEEPVWQKQCEAGTDFTNHIVAAFWPLYLPAHLGYVMFDGGRNEGRD